MTTITQVATWKASTNTVALQATIDGRAFSVAHVNINKNTTAAQLEAAAATWAAAQGITLPEFHVHINDDRSLAVAFGPAPQAWPEDET